MESETRSIDTETLKQALTKVGDYLQQTGKKYELVCAGGVVSCLYFKSRNSTDDVDVIFPPSKHTAKLLRKVIHRVAKDFNLKSNWMNDSIRFFGLETRSNNVIFRHKGLTLVSAKWEELLAHKLAAYRNTRDIKDATLILKQISDSDKDQVFNEVLKYQPISPFVKKEEMRKRFDEVWDIIHRISENIILKKVGLLTEDRRKFKSTLLPHAA